MRKKQNIANVANKVFLSALLFCFSGLVSMAEVSSNNLLSAVEIRNSDNGYAILLKADKAAEVRKNVESQDEIYLDIAGMTPSESVGTIYNDVPEIDSVIIQPTDNEGTRILLHGKNIASSTVGFESVNAVSQNVAPSGERAKEEISLNAPVQAYAPVFNQTDEYQEEDSASLLATAASMAVSAASDSLPIVKKVVKYVFSLDKKYLAFGGIFFLIILLGFKAIKPNKDNEIKIGLSQSLKDKELDMRAELSLAEDYKTLRNTSSLSEKSAPSINYGIKAYQNSQKNPYTSQISGLPMRKTNPMASSAPKQNVAQQPFNNPKLNPIQKPLPSRRTPMPAPSAVNRPSVSATNSVKNVDSLKFLESMAQIYERNGRADLASELKSNIRKVQVAK